MHGEQRSIVIVGLGLLGSALAEHLIHGGWDVDGYDLDPARRESFADLGGRPYETLSRMTAAEPGLLLLSLPTSDVVSSVLDEIADALPSSTIVVDTTTSSPEASESHFRRLEPGGVEFLDATIAGSSEEARRGQISVMVGGTRAAYEKCQSLWSALAEHVYYMGPSGSGSRMKLVLNLVLGLNRAVLAEALALAKRAGIDERLALDVLRSSVAYSRVMDVKGEKMLRGDFQPAARLAQHLKDVRLILEMGRQADARLPLSKLHERLLADLVEAGYGDEDNSAILRAFDDRRSGDEERSDID